LTAGFDPHFDVLKPLLKVGWLISGVVTLEVHSDSEVSAFESPSLDNHDEDEEDGKRHGDPDDVRTTVDSFPHAEVDNDPGDQSGDVLLSSEMTLARDLSLSVHKFAIVVDRSHDVLVEEPVQELTKALRQSFQLHITIKASTLTLRRGKD